MNSTAYLVVGIDKDTGSVTGVGVCSEPNPTTTIHTATAVLRSTTADNYQQASDEMTGMLASDPMLLWVDLYLKPGLRQEVNEWLDRRIATELGWNPKKRSAFSWKRHPLVAAVWSFRMGDYTGRTFIPDTDFQYTFIPEAAPWLEAVRSIVTPGLAKAKSVARVRVLALEALSAHRRKQARKEA